MTKANTEQEYIEQLNKLLLNKKKLNKFILDKETLPYILKREQAKFKISVNTVLHDIKLRKSELTNVRKLKKTFFDSQSNKEEIEMTALSALEEAFQKVINSEFNIDTYLEQHPTIIEALSPIVNDYTLVKGNPLIEKIGIGIFFSCAIALFIGMLWLISTPVGAVFPLAAKILYRGGTLGVLLIGIFDAIFPDFKKAEYQYKNRALSSRIENIKYNAKELKELPEQIKNIDESIRELTTLLEQNRIALTAIEAINNPVKK